MAGALLFAQIMGVHRHLHSESGAAFHRVTSELHFADAGLHADEHHDAAAAGHHGDVEVSALGDALSKLTLKLLPLGLLMLATMLLLVRVPRALPRPCNPDPAPRRHPFSLHPPANGPPQLHSTAL